MAVMAVLLGSCTGHRRASDPVEPDGDTIEVTIGATAPDTVAPLEVTIN